MSLWPTQGPPPEQVIITDPEVWNGMTLEERKQHISRIRQVNAKHTRSPTRLIAHPSSLSHSVAHSPPFLSHLCRCLLSISAGPPGLPRVRQHVSAGQRELPGRRGGGRGLLSVGTVTLAAAKPRRALHGAGIDRHMAGQQQSAEGMRDDVPGARGQPGPVSDRRTRRPVRTAVRPRTIDYCRVEKVFVEPAQCSATTRCTFDQNE